MEKEKFDKENTHFQWCDTIEQMHKINIEVLSRVPRFLDMLQSLVIDRIVQQQNQYISNMYSSTMRNDKIFVFVQN